MSLSDAQVRATIAVSDITRAAAFYERTLGLSPLGDDAMEHVRIYQCGAGSVLQVYASEHAGTASATVASWSTDEFESVVDDLSPDPPFRRPVPSGRQGRMSKRSVGQGDITSRWRISWRGARGGRGDL
jgi:catechol 2,3-dioxygenase-like lactoylglutathione lyase family enzyme